MINVRNITKYVLISVLVLCANFLLAQNTVSLNIKDMPVRDVITNLMAQSDVNIIMTDDARMDKKIRINLSDCDLEKALNYIMQASGLSFKKVDDNTYIIGGSATDNGLNSLFSPESLLNSVNSKVVDSDNELSSVPSNKGIRDVKVIELQHVGATELLKTLGYYDGPSANVYNNVDTFKTHNARIKYQDNGQISVPSINPYINDGSGRTAELDTLPGQWGGFTGGSTSVLASKDLVKKIYFPRQVIPISYVTSCFVNMLLCFIVIFAVVLVSGTGFNFAAVLTLPVIMLVEYLLSLGMALLASAVTVYFRDLEHILGIISMVWMYMTPIMYSKSIVPNRLLPIFNLNPMTHVIECYRDVLYSKQMPDLTSLLSAVFLGVFFLALGGIVFNKLQKHFAEEL